MKKLQHISFIMTLLLCLMPAVAWSQVNVDQMIYGSWMMKSYYQSDYTTATPPSADSTDKQWYEEGFDDSSWGNLTGAIEIESEPACYYLRQEVIIDKDEFVDTSGNLDISLSFDNNVEVYFNSIQIGSFDGENYGFFVTVSIPWSGIKNGTNTLAIYYENEGGPGSLDLNFEGIGWNPCWSWTNQNNGIASMKCLRGESYIDPDSIKIVNIDASMQNWNGESCSGLFSGQTSLTQINNLSNLNTSSVTDMSYMFSGCSSLTSLYLSNWDTSSVTNMYSMFSGCSSLTSLDLPANIQTLYPHMFEFCTNLRTLNLPASITEIQEWTFDGSSIGEIIFDDNITAVPSNGCWVNGINVYVPANMFPAFNSSPNWTKDMGWNISTKEPNPGDWLTVEVVCRPTQANNGQDLHDVLLQKGYAEDDFPNIYALKIVGTINSYDVILMRNKLINLQHLDISEARVVYNEKEYVTGYNTEDDVITTNFFQGWTSLNTLILPNSITAIYNSACPSVETLAKVTVFDNVESIGASAFANCSNLRTVSIGDGCRTIGNEAFANCGHLSTVSIGDGCQSIGASAFADCSSLRQIDLPQTLTVIGNNAFQYSGLTSITLPEGIETIHRGTFYGCGSLKEVNFPSNLTTIEDEAFNFSGLQGLEFPTSLETIGTYAFANNGNLSSVEFPDDVAGGEENWVKLQSIGYGAFENCTSLKIVILPEFDGTIGDHAFAGCNAITDYEMKWFDPKRNTSMETFSNYRSAELHVQPAAFNNYYWNTEWSQFLRITTEAIAIPDSVGGGGGGSGNGQIESNGKWTTNNDNSLEDGDRYDAVDLNMNSGSSMEVKGDDVQPFTYVYMKGDGDGCFASLIDHGNITVERLFFDISVRPGQWYFYTFPFRVKVSDIVAPGKHIFRYYDGNERAANGYGGWKNLPEGQEYLEPGKGYIFQCNEEGVMRAEAVEPVFDGQDKANELEAFVGEEEANSGWNLMGNPYPSYFDLNVTGYTHPVTIWNGWDYDTYRPGDDDYMFHPFEAFFVQKPADASDVNFPTTGRYTYNSALQHMSQAPRLVNKENTDRKLINLTLSDGMHTDRTRVVFNGLKKDAYETGDDAAKFFSTGVMQLYTVDAAGTCYAINERPEGEVKVGVRIAKDGSYTIAAQRMDRAVLLKDLLTGKTTDLSENSYSFECEAGTYDNRFLLVPNTGVDEINEMASEGILVKVAEDGLLINGAELADVKVYQLNGTLVKAISDNGLTKLPKGVYLVKVNNMTTKVTVK